MSHHSQSELLLPNEPPYRDIQGDDSSWTSDAASDSNIPIPGEEIDWEQRFKKFLGSFMTEIETKFKVYHTLLENRNNLDGVSFGSELGKGLGCAVGSLVGYFFSCQGVLGNVGGKVGELAGGKLCELSQQSKRKNLSHLIYYYCENKKEQRKILIEAGFQVFRSFESLIMDLKGKRAWQTYVNTFGQDAAHRLINFCAEENVGKFTVNVVTKGIVLGKSKKQKPPALNQRGLKIKFRGLQVTTDDIFRNVGLVDLRNKKYYARKEVESDVCDYGYRILFSWELDEFGSISAECSENYEIKYILPENEYNYVSSAGYCSRTLNDFTTAFCSKEEQITGEEFRQVLIDLKDEIEDKVSQNVIPKHICVELKQLIDNISMQIHIVEEESSLTRQHSSQEHKITKASIIKDSEEKHEITRQFFKKELDLLKVHMADEFERLRHSQRGKSITLDFTEPVDSFTGRKRVLDDLYLLFHRKGGSRRVVVTGPSGVGKSELARKYAVQHCEEYDCNILWVNAKSYNALHGCFTRLAEMLGVKTEKKYIEPTERKLTDIVSDIYDHLGDRKCLFIFDDAQNCNTVESLNNFFPDQTVKGAHVIVTSCTAAWDLSMPRIDLEMFGELETLELLEKLLGQKYEREDAIDVGNLLHHLPLALQLASSYITTQDITLFSFIEEYKQKKLQEHSFEFTDSSMDSSTKIVFTTFHVIVNKIKQYGESEAINILNILAYLNPDNIPQHLFSDFGDEILIKNAIKVLKSYSLIIQKPNEPLLKMLKLVQKVIRKFFINIEKSVLEKALGLLKFKNQTNPEDAVTQQTEYIWQYAVNYPKLIKDYQDVLEFPLHLAAHLRQLEMVKHLLENADVSIYKRDRGGMTALYRANQQDNNLEVIKYLIRASAEHDFTVNKEDWIILEKAAEENEVEILKFLIYESCGDQFLEKNLLLHLAAQKGRLDVLLYLVNNGCYVLSHRNRVTVLHEAAYSNDAAVVGLVLDSIDAECSSCPTRKARFINAQDNRGDTPLMWAAKAWKRNAVEVLRKHGADASVKNSDGNTALDLAMQTAHELLG